MCVRLLCLLLVLLCCSLMCLLFAACRWGAAGPSFLEHCLFSALPVCSDANHAEATRRRSMSQLWQEAGEQHVAVVGRLMYAG